MQKISTEIYNVESSLFFLASTRHTERADLGAHIGGAVACFLLAEFLHGSTSSTAAA